MLSKVKNYSCFIIVFFRIIVLILETREYSHNPLVSLQVAPLSFRVLALNARSDYNKVCTSLVEFRITFYQLDTRSVHAQTLLMPMLLQLRLLS